MDNRFSDAAHSPEPAAQATADGFLTYASFSADGARGPKAGWRVGQQVGVSEELAAELIEKTPIHLATEASVPRYVGDEERKNLIRRAVWATVPKSGTPYVFMHSTPAGTDASGRPSNVFSTMYVFAESNRMSAYPVQFLGSPSVLVPFNAEVNNLKVAGPGIEVNADLTPRHAFESLMSNTRRGFNAIRDTVLTVLDLLAAGTRVVIADDPKNAPHWLVLVTMATDSLTARGITFSTYERGAALAKDGGPVHDVSVVPASDHAQLADAHLGGAVVLDVTQAMTRGRWRGEPTRYSDSDGAEVEVSALAELYAFVVSSPAAADRLLQEPVVGGARAEKLAVLALEDSDAAFESVSGPLEETLRNSSLEGDLAQKINALKPGLSESQGRHVKKREEQPERHSYDAWTPAAAPAHPPQPGENPFAASAPGDGQTPAETPPTEDAPETPAGLLPAVARPVSEKELSDAQYLLETAKWDFARRKRMPWYAMTERLLIAAPEDSPIGRAQTHLFAAAVVDVINSPRVPGDEVAVLPFWRLFLPESTAMLQTVLQLAVEHIGQISAVKNQPKDGFRDKALRLSEQYRNPHPDFARVLRKLAADIAPGSSGRSGQQGGHRQQTPPHNPYQYPPHLPPRR